MTRKAWAVFAATSVALVASTSDVVIARDSEVLFQRYLELAPSEATLDKKTKVQGTRPFSEIWDEVKQTASSITETFGEVATEATAKVDEVTDTVRQAADGMAKKLASVLEEVVKKIQAESDRLLKETHQNKVKFMDEVNSTIMTTSDKVIPEFAALVNKLVSQIDAPWKSLKTVVKEAASTIASAFKAAGQVKLSTAIESGIDTAVHYVDKFIEKLDAANHDLLDRANKLATKDVDVLLKRVDDKLNEALQQISQFILQFQDAFTELIDSLSNAVSFTSADVDAAFAPVHHRVTSVAWRVRSAGRDAILPIHNGLVRVAKQKGVHAPVWHPVEMPVLQHSGTVKIAGLSLTMVFALFTAATRS